MSYLVERGQAVFTVHQLCGGHLLRQLKLTADHLELGADPHHSPVTVVLQGLIASLTALSKSGPRYTHWEYSNNDQNLNLNVSV